MSFCQLINWVMFVCILFCMSLGLDLAIACQLHSLLNKVCLVGCFSLHHNSVSCWRLACWISHYRTVESSVGWIHPHSSCCWKVWTSWLRACKGTSSLVRLYYFFDIKWGWKTVKHLIIFDIKWRTIISLT